MGGRTAVRPRTDVGQDELATLYRERLSHLVAYFRSKGIGREESRDLAHDTVLRTLLHLKRHGRTRDDIGPLTRTIARNLVVERIRRSGPAVVPLSDDVDAPDDAPEPFEVALTNERREAVRAALASLTPRHRRVIELWMQGRSPSEIARELGIKRNAADAILHRARRSLASRLGPRALWGGVVVLWIRFRTASREAANRLAAQLAAWSQQSPSLTAASVSLATAGLAAVIAIGGSAPAVTPSHPAPAKDVADAMLVVDHPETGTVKASRAPVSVRAGDDGGDEDTPDVTAGSKVINPTTGEEDDFGVDVWYEPATNAGMVERAVMPVLEHSCIGGCVEEN
jgi:RNA polymerase sigma factor (sigma-70 family)